MNLAAVNNTRNHTLTNEPLRGRFSFTGDAYKYTNKIITSKYTLLTFLPLNFFHQVSKASTFFFFITLILLCIPKISPFEPYTYILAFVIIVGISMIKDAMEDYKRHKDDEKINKTIVKTVELLEVEEGNPKFIILEKYCMELKKGDFILAENGKEIQADVVLLRSKSYYKNKIICSNNCFIETSNIDGESNLKKRTSFISPKNYSCCKTKKELQPAVTEPICKCCMYFFKNIRSFELKDTGDSFNNFECDFNISGKLKIATEKNVLLRGSILKNTMDSLCIVASVGSETKQSKSFYKSKKTKTLFDEKMNFILIVVLVLYALMLSITTLFSWIFLRSNRNVFYLNITNTQSTVLNLLFSNYILYTYMIPLSLYVMLEIARFVQMLYIGRDSSMKINGKASRCRNSNVIGDLGLIDYILTDKTGTITKNAMTLKYIHEKNHEHLTLPNDLCKKIADEIRANVKKSNESIPKVIEEIIKSDSAQRDQLLIILNMLLCNSVEILNQTPQGISQEELCFLKSISDHGFRLLERDSHFVCIEILGTPIKIDLLSTLDFSSRKQRMDITVAIFGKYFMLSKGSDQKLLDKKKDKNVLKVINASTDFRCLVMKYKELTKEEINKFEENVKSALEANEDEKKGGLADKRNFLALKKCAKEDGFSKFEKNANYLGTTFIEDELQDQVQETIRVLKEAGIKIWMVTGDKKETAISCGKNSCIIEDTEYLALNGKKALSLIEKCIEEDKKKLDSPKFFGRYVRSEEDIHTQSNESGVENIFKKKSVIIYRATPSQKGKIAAYLAKSSKNTLAIGDGNNDIAMLKDSHVGVGIMGKEGTQAALSADFAIPEFRVLKTLVLIHGRYSFMKYTKVGLNSYYKNIVFIFAQFIYNLYTGASASPLYNSFTLNYYNIFFTSMIPFSICLFDRDVTPEHAVEQPSGYKYIRSYFDPIFVFANVGFAVFESILIFFAIRFLTFNDITNGSGILGASVSFSTIFSIVVIYSVILRQLRQISYHVIYTDIAIALTVILNLFSIFVLQELYSKNNYTIYYLLLMPNFYFICLCLGTMIYTVDTLFANYILYLEEQQKTKN
ncbi:hypothetical protein GINT2_001271 [Glugoides intestinalis]